MKRIERMRDFPHARAVAALGMFDGVHIGHQALIREAVRQARDLDAKCVVCTFDRHPLSLIAPERAPKPLMTLEENLARFERLGADYALVQRFDRAFSQMPPEDYLRALAVELRAVGIVAGENYTFGLRGTGNAEKIRELAETLGYRAVIVPPVMDGDRIASSTWIRQLLAQGEFAHAQRLLELR